MHCAIIKYPVLFNIRKTNCNEKKIWISVVKQPQWQQGSATMPRRGRNPANHCVGHLELRIPRDGKWWLQASWQHQHGGPELFVKDIFVISEKSEKGYLKAKHLPAVFSSIYSSFFSNLLATGLTLGSACSFLWFSQSQVLPFCHCSIFSVFVYYVPCVPSLFSLLFSFLFCEDIFSVILTMGLWLHLIFAIFFFK